MITPIYTQIVRKLSIVSICVHKCNGFHSCLSKRLVEFESD